MGAEKNSEKIGKKIEEFSRELNKGIVQLTMELTEVRRQTQRDPNVRITPDIIALELMIDSLVDIKKAINNCKGF